MTAKRARPWYREPWPWLLMAGPALTVVAGFVTLWLAMASDDGLVADDYYKRGLAINQTLSRDRAAAALAYRAHLSFNPEAGRVRVVLSCGPARSPAVRLHIAHPTRAGLDRALMLEARGAGVYEAALALPASGRWRVTVEDTAGVWRLAGEWKLPDSASIVLEPRRNLPDSRPTDSFSDGRPAESRHATGCL